MDDVRALTQTAGLSPPASLPPARPNCEPRFPVSDSNTQPASPSPLHRERWAYALCNYPGGLAAVIDGLIAHGAKLGYDGPRLRDDRRWTGNLEMTTEELEHVWASVSARVAKGWSVLVGTGESVAVSPIGVVPKANGKLRTINHLSWPRRRAGHPSVNDGIPIDNVSMSYGHLDGLFAAVRAADYPVELWKADLADAFYHIVVAHTDSRLLAFELDGQTYRDTTLNFGGRSSLHLFDLLAEALHWVCESLGFKLDHYLDDLFGLALRGAGAPTIAAYRAVCEHLGVTVSPSNCLHGRRSWGYGSTRTPAERGSPTNGSLRCARASTRSFLRQPPPRKRFSPLPERSTSCPGSARRAARSCVASATQPRRRPRRGGLLL